MKKLIVTVGPSLIKNAVLKEIHRKGNIYRINAAHNDAKSLTELISQIRNLVPYPEILIDLPGNKIRTSNLVEAIPVYKNKKFKLDASVTNFPDFIKYIKTNDSIYADDSTLHFTVDSFNNNEIILNSNSDGLLKKNKGLHIRGIHSEIPFLFEKDLSIIEVANNAKVDFVGLSFVRNVKDINEARSLIDTNITLIPKVETKAAVANLEDILSISEYILVDRGDLSTEVGLERVPYYQNYIIEKALFYNRRIFLATQFLKNMETNPIPTIAEIVDLYNTFKKGIYGIQLSEETAIGKFPKECLKFTDKVLDIIENEKHSYSNS